MHIIQNPKKERKKKKPGNPTRIAWASHKLDSFNAFPTNFPSSPSQPHSLTKPTFPFNSDTQTHTHGHRRALRPKPHTAPATQPVLCIIKCLLLMGLDWWSSTTRARTTHTLPYITYKFTENRTRINFSTVWPLKWMYRSVLRWLSKFYLSGPRVWYAPRARYICTVHANFTAPHISS